MGRGKKIVDIELVIDQAVALIDEGGVEEFSTRRLASRLGISAMTLYNYYENRDAILKEALMRGLGLLWAGLEVEVAEWRAKGGDGLGAYRVLADHILAFAASRPRLCHFVLAESSGTDWTGSDSPVERICCPDSGTRADDSRGAVYLFELVVFALALKVISGGETAERYDALVDEAFELLLANGRSQSST